MEVPGEVTGPVPTEGAPATPSGSDGDAGYPVEANRGDERGAGRGERGTPRSTRLSARELDALVEAMEGKDPESRRFSMWGLLCIVTAASIVLSLGSYLPRPVFAGIVGIATLVSMVALSAMKNPPAALQAAWWVLLLIYLMSIASAVWG
ncbi:MAG TPA: hypothetical protein VG826_14780 [Pirellulales bacterium]|nr:hypothetical protein [Pirellulales bacterium]